MRQPGEPYRPSSGTEGMAFLAHYCDVCKHDNYSDEHPERGCDILAESYGDGAAEWIWVEGKSRGWSDNLVPFCTHFYPENACPINARPKPPRQVDGQLTFEQVDRV